MILLLIPLIRIFLTQIQTLMQIVIQILTVILMQILTQTKIMLL